MKVPYAKCDFADIRRRGYFYVDKTPFLSRLEATNEDHVIFLRPRRFGKSTLISTLANYYDINKAHEFDELFGGLWIHQNPTPNHNKYLVLTLDFSPVDTSSTIERVCTSFAVQIKASVRSFIHRYMKVVPGLQKFAEVTYSPTEDMAALMSDVLTEIGNAGHRMYLLIDEYDHFGNRLLSDGRDDMYKELIQSSGFVRSFYAALKAFTLSSTIARTFITGVSPIMLDDLSSGFNIITHISMRSVFNGMAGFTQADVERAVDTMLSEKQDAAKDPRIADRKVLLDTLKNYYDGYRFAPNARENMYNSTLVLYFLAELDAEQRFPRNMLDLNVRTDYNRLYGLVTAASGKELGTRELLENVLLHGCIETPVVERFGTALPLGQAQIASLFYYMGMLTFASEAAERVTSHLVVPNRVMRELQWSYLSYVKTNAKPETIEKVVAEGHAQLDKYMADQGIVQMLTLGKEIKAGVLVFVGLKRIEFRPWPRSANAETISTMPKSSAKKKSRSKTKTSR
ncbi:MAG TPA: AAA family ATPase [Polyangium sp.]|nr:AAA family ATPase [Polyangium sp.]